MWTSLGLNQGPPDYEFQTNPATGFIHPPPSPTLLPQLFGKKSHFGLENTFNHLLECQVALQNHELRIYFHSKGHDTHPFPFFFSTFAP